MKKLVLSLAILGALGLSGCGSETIEDVKQDVIDNDTAVPISGRVIFDPSNGVLSVPNDLLFQGTIDGTLNIPVDDPTNGGDPYVALNGLDGWSTANPFVLDIGFPDGVSLDGNSVFSPNGVRIFEAVMGGGPDECADVALGLACKIVGELTYTVDFITQKSGNAVAVVPLKPLKPKTAYLLAMTNHLKDDSGKNNPIAGSTTYELVRQDIATKPLGNAAQLGLQAVINSYEAAVVAAGVDKDSIIYTSAMTTQSTTDVLFTNKQLMAGNAQLFQATSGAQGSIPQIGMVDTGISVADVFAMLGENNPIPDSLMPMYSSANYLKGSITLPYYSGIPTQANRMAPVNEWWTSLCDSGAMLAGLAAANPAAIPEGPLSASDGACMAVSAAGNLPAPGLRDLSSVMPLDVDRHLTKYSPVVAPKPASDIDGMKHPGVIDIQMTTPDLAVASAVRMGMGLPALTKPEGGWPIVILQHGITSKKEDMLAITGILSLYGLATVAIDHPLHGSRGFDINGDMVDDINASTVSATHYMNLASLLTTRDNLRQSSSDILGLRFGLNFMGGFDAGMNPIDLEVNRGKIHFLGHSLGAITGINFLALANTSLDEAIDPMFKVSTNTLAMPGVMVANFLMESGAFGDVIKASVAYSGYPPFTAEVDGLYPVVDGNSTATEAQLVETYLTYVAANPSAQGDLGGLFAQFAFAAQTVTDAGDPINYTATLAATQTPTHVIEVVGTGVACIDVTDPNNCSDQVIPNTVSSAPLAGTEPAIAFLGLPPIYEQTQSTESVSGAVRFLFGSHSSILSPAHQPGVTASPEMAGRATLEMQNQVANFFSSDGTLISVQDTDIVLNPN